MTNQATKGTLSAGAMNLPGVALKTLVINLNGTIAASEVDTGGRLPAHCVVQDVMVDVQTAPTANGTSIGFHIGTLSSASGGDADGFAVGIPVGTAGIKIPSLVGAAAARTLGALLTETVTDSGTATHPARLPGHYIGTVNRAVSITGVEALSGFKGKIVIRYLDLRNT